MHGGPLAQGNSDKGPLSIKSAFDTSQPLHPGAVKRLTSMESMLLECKYFVYKLAQKIGWAITANDRRQEKREQVRPFPRNSVHPIIVEWQEDPDHPGL